MRKSECFATCEPLSRLGGGVCWAACDQGIGFNPLKGQASHKHEGGGVQGTGGLPPVQWFMAHPLPRRGKRRS
jgi:hypothetical protein